jgi:hypothetical protein
MAKSKKVSVDRRGFLKGAAAGATVLAVKPEALKHNSPMRAAPPLRPEARKR